MSIHPLPEDVRAQIRSSVEITSLLDVAEGLLRNALDAGADSVSITLDFAKGFCAVQDDGSGIASSEFSEGGNLARMHCEGPPTIRLPATSSQNQSLGNPSSNPSFTFGQVLTAQVPRSSDPAAMEAMDASSPASLPYRCSR